MLVFYNFCVADNILLNDGSTGKGKIYLLDSSFIDFKKCGNNQIVHISKSLIKEYRINNDTMCFSKEDTASNKMFRITPGMMDTESGMLVSKETLCDRVRSGQRRLIIGNSIIGAGIPTTCIGIILLSVYSGTYHLDEVVLGLISAAVGTGMIIGGPIYRFISRPYIQDYRNYKDKCNEYSMSLSFEF